MNCPHQWLELTSSFPGRKVHVNMAKIARMHRTSVDTELYDGEVWIAVKETPQEIMRLLADPECPQFHKETV